MFSLNTTPKRILLVIFVVVILGLVLFPVFRPARFDRPNYAGALQGSFQVNSSGAATYSVPISVPPGTHDMAPKLSINYTSSSGNGLLGMGFSMRGLPTIERVAATLAQDGFTGSINYNANDRFSLNGTRLINTEGIYGDDGTVYHTEIESWKKVTSYGTDCGSGPCYFELITKKGDTLEFGNTGDSRIESTSTDSITGKSVGVRVWALTKVTDLNGNYITFKYKEDSENGSYYPLEISYTGNTATGLSPQRSVQFVYEDRTDTVATYQGGGLIKNTQRLDSISTYVGEENVLNYKLQYHYSVSTGRSLLVSVKECDSVGKCLPATTFSWQDGDKTLFGNPQTSSQEIRTGQSLMPLDINGDGLIDFANLNTGGKKKNNPTQLNAYISNGTTFATADSINFDNETGGAFYATDLNGDGLGDMMKVYLNEQLTVNTFLSNGTGFEAPLVYNGPDTITYGTFENAFLSPADANGDGRTDLVHAYYNSDTDTVQLTNFLSTGKSFEPQPTQDIHFRDQTGGSLSAMDVNGDGVSDLVYVSTGNVDDHCFKITPLFSRQGTSYEQGQTQPFPLSNSEGKLLSADVNGDGMSDVIYVYPTDSLSIYFSTGKDFVEVKQSLTYPREGWLMAMEVNGDNLTDLTYVSNTNGQLITYLSTGNNFQAGDTTIVSIPAAAALHVPIPMDINGDAKTDLLFYQTKSGNTDHFKFTKIMASGPYPDLIDTLDNGIGGSITVDYKPLTDKNVYQMAGSETTGSYPVNSVLNKISGATYAHGTDLTTTTGATYPVVNVTLPIYAVARYTQQDGRGGVYPYSYFYRDARVDRNGRGWLGFKSQTMTDSSSQNITNTWYHQLFPLSGKTDSTTTYTLDNELMSKNSTVYQVITDIPGSNDTIYQINQIQSRSDMYDYGTFAYTLQKDYEYDNYGNARRIIDWGIIARSKPLYTVNTYHNDTVSWKLGYLTHTLNVSDTLRKDTLSQQTIVYHPRSKNVLSKRYWIAAGKHIDTSYVYDDYGNMTHSTDQAGGITRVVYDTTYHTFPVQHISPANQWGKNLTSSFEYDPYFGKIKHYTDPNGNSLQIIFDGLGRAKEVKGPDEEGTMVSLGKIDYIPDPGVGYSTLKSIRLDWKKEIWQTTQNFYDGIIRNYKTYARGQDNKLVIQQKEYNSENKVTRRSFPYFRDSTAYWAHVYYDPYERIEKVVVPTSATDSIINRASYQGRSITVTQASGTADSTQVTLVYDYYNSQRKYTQQTNASKDTTQVHYDPLGRVKKVYDPQSIGSELWYDGIGRRTKARDSSFGTTTYLYDDYKRIYQVVNAKGDTISRTMDALGRMILEKRPKEIPTRYQYDLEGYANAQGKLAKVLMKPQFYYTYTYSRYGSVDTTLLHLEGKSHTQVQKYKPNRSPAQLVFPDESVQAYHYTTQGLLKDIKLTDTGNPDAETQTYINYQQYDARGDILKVLYGNQVSSSYSYTPLGKIQSYSLNNAQDTVLIDKTYTWNDAMQIETVTDLLDSVYTQNFSYDPSGRLLSADGIYGDKTYLYDPSGNITLKDSVNYTYDNYQVINGTAQDNPDDTVFQAAYNEVGNRISKTVEENGEQVQYKYKYDVLNRLTGVEKEGSLLYTYMYDYTGRRVQKIDFKNNVVSTYVSPNYEITKYVDSTVYTKNILGANGLVATVSHSDSGTENAAPVGGMPTTGVLYFHQDHIGNTKLTTSAEGEQQSKIVYQPYGQIYQPDSVSVGPDNFRYKFGGKELDEGANLYYFNARYYDPQTGRFITADTQLGGHPWQADVLNRYAYVLNNPIKYSDPSGHGIWKDIVTGIIVAVTVTAEAVVAVGTAGAAIPEEAALDAGVVSAEVGADVAADAATDAAVESSAESMGDDAVDSATEDLTDSDPEKVNEKGKSMCFVAGTKIATKNGLKNIEEIKEGDEVWSYNEETGKNELRKVVDTYERIAKKLVILSVNGEEIKTTEEHPFSVEGRWVPAGHLKEGDKLKSIKGKMQKIEDIRFAKGDFHVYNMAVSEGHNYFVSTAYLLVHNMNCAPSASDDDNTLFSDSSGDDTDVDELAEDHDYDARPAPDEGLSELINLDNPYDLRNITNQDLGNLFNEYPENDVINAERTRRAEALSYGFIQNNVDVILNNNLDPNDLQALTPFILDANPQETAVSIGLEE